MVFVKNNNIPIYYLNEEPLEISGFINHNHYKLQYINLSMFFDFTVFHYFFFFFLVTFLPLSVFLYIFKNIILNHKLISRGNINADLHSEIVKKTKRSYF